MHNAQFARVGQLQSTLQQFPRLGLELLAVSGLAILVISMLAQGRALAAVLPTLGLFAAAAFRLLPSVNRVLGAVQSLRYGLPVFDIMHIELNLATPEVDGTQRPATPFRTALELSRITYAYPGAAGPALKDISLAIQYSIGRYYRPQWHRQEHAGGYSARSAHPRYRRSASGRQGHSGELAELAGLDRLCAAVDLPH